VTYFSYPGESGHSTPSFARRQALNFVTRTTIRAVPITSSPKLTNEFSQVCEPHMPFGQIIDRVLAAPLQSAIISYPRQVSPNQFHQSVIQGLSRVSMCHIAIVDCVTIASLQSVLIPPPCQMIRPLAPLRMVLTTAWRSKLLPGFEGKFRLKVHLRELA